MGNVKIKLADRREVTNADGEKVDVAAGEVVEVDEGTARVLGVQNIGFAVDSRTKVTAGTAAAKTTPETSAADAAAKK